jgi:hypothetical protein
MFDPQNDAQLADCVRAESGTVPDALPQYLSRKTFL